MSKIIVYPYSYVFQKKRTMLLWLSSEQDNDDRFLVSGDGDLYIAYGVDNAKVKFADLPYQINWDEGAEVNFDDFWVSVRALSLTSSNVENCEIILEGWNFIEDVLRTYSLNDVRCKLDSIQLDSAYEKIFSGSSLGALKSLDHVSDSILNKSELLNIKRDLKNVWDEVGELVEGLW